MRIGFKSHPGMVRDNNEDFLIVDRDMGLSLVADGLGGNLAGEVASRLCAQTVYSLLKEELHSKADCDVETIIKEAINRAHREVYSRAMTHRDNEGMGTTIVLALCIDNTLYIAHVGDSRAYIYSSGKITQITEDHSLVANLVRAGAINKVEARSHRLKHVISQCVGCDSYEGPDIIKLPYDDGTILLLCSDGLTDMLDEDSIQRVINMKSGDLQECAEALVNEANNNGGVDNITLILMDKQKSI